VSSRAAISLPSLCENHAEDAAFVVFDKFVGDASPIRIGLHVLKSWMLVSDVSDHQVDADVLQVIADWDPRTENQSPCVLARGVST
jgi:hypothetical protein